MSLTVAEATSSISSEIAAAATRSRSLLHRYRIGSGYRRPLRQRRARAITSLGASAAGRIVMWPGPMV